MRLPLALTLSGLLFTAVSASADDKGFYVGAGIGEMNTEVDDGYVYPFVFDFDESDVGFKIFGGYKFFPWLSVEGAYIDGGNPEVKGSDGDFRGRLGIEVQALVASAVFALPIGEQFEIFLKPGIAYWDSSTSISVTSPAFSETASSDDSGSAFFLGAGGGWNIGSAGLRLEYEWFDVAPEYDYDSNEFKDELDASAGFWSLSFIYHF